MILSLQPPQAFYSDRVYGSGMPEGDPEDKKDAVEEAPAVKYLSVSQLNRSVKALINSEPGLQGVWVLGEFSNLRPVSSGHCYPTLKDEDSEIGCVIWARTLRQLSVRPEEGMKVLVYGDVDVYERKGRYQLVVRDVRRFGVGDLYARMEALKAKLKKEGLFDRKRPLPEFPRIVGLVTSDTGAAVQDMIRIIGRRFPIARMILVPVLVQGAEAAEDIAAGIQEMNGLREPRPDVMIVGRGGGSIEDLWAFNEEVVARAMFASDIPVISAVGHETDFTIADFVADLRAATPSEAAEKVVPDKEALLGQMDGTQEALFRMMTDAIQSLEQGLDDEALQLEGAMGELLVSGSRDIDHVAEMLESLGPRKVLKRGYAIVTREGETVSSVAVLHPRDNVEITVTDGKAGAEIQKVKRVRTV